MAAALAALSVVALTGCESAADSRRNDVNRYIASVNEVQREVVTPWARAKNAYNELRGGVEIDEQQLRTLGTVPRTIRSLRRSIAAMTPPAEAKRLHAALLRLLDLDARFAEEVASFARYTRGSAPIQNRVAAETTTLRRELRRSRASGQDRRALEVYASRLEVLVGRMRRLEPPPALVPWHAQQVTRLTQLRRGAHDLAEGLVRRDRALAQRALQTFTGAAAAASTVTVADRAAILAYNRRSERIRAAAAAVAREQNRLAEELT